MSGSRWSSGSAPRGDDYDARWDRLAEQGQNPHGEADFVTALGVRRVLDAGCGTGRVAIELDRRGHEVVGVDLDEHMLATARRKGPHVEWHVADLARLDLVDDVGERRRFDAVVLAGNVMIFLASGTEGDVVARLAEHLSPGGVLVAGFQLHTEHLDLATYDRLAAANGLDLEARYSTWHHDGFTDTDGYAVSIHRRRRAST
ncbi:MAG: class I SAM-dependent methyltransferase [Acidimicrobiales bacterium]|nr:class I SAM-dependent methyltransferase [Acidimicrobiales bacterium]